MAAVIEGVIICFWERDDWCDNASKWLPSFPRLILHVWEHVLWCIRHGGFERYNILCLCKVVSCMSGDLKIYYCADRQVWRLWEILLIWKLNAWDRKVRRLFWVRWLPLIVFLHGSIIFQYLLLSLWDNILYAHQAVYRNDNDQDHDHNIILHVLFLMKILSVKTNDHPKLNTLMWTSHIVYIWHCYSSKHSVFIIHFSIKSYRRHLFSGTVKAVICEHHLSLFCEFCFICHLRSYIS